MTDHIETERLTLRAAVPADVEAMAEGLGDFEVSKWLARVPHPFGAKDVCILNDDGSSTWPDYAAIALEGRVIGGLRLIPHMGFWLTRKHWGHGYMTEAARAGLRRHFASAGARDVVAGVFHGNTASEHLLARLGFVRDEASGRREFCAARGMDLPISDHRLTSIKWEARA